MECIPLGSSESFCQGYKADAAIPLEREEGNDFQEVGYSSSENWVLCHVGPRLGVQLCFCKALGNFS